MMTTLKTATCGHSVKKLRLYVVKGVSNRGYHLLKYQTLCSDCLIDLESKGLIAHTYEEEQEWLKSKVVEYADE